MDMHKKTKGKYIVNIERNGTFRSTGKYEPAGKEVVLDLDALAQERMQPPMPTTFNNSLDEKYKRSFLPFSLGKKKKMKKYQKNLLREQLKKEVEMTEHWIPENDLFQRLGTNPETGLNSERAKEILAKNGPNALSPPKKVPEWKKFLKEMFGGFSLLLWVGGIASIIAYIVQKIMTSNASEDNVIIGAVLIAVVVLTGCLSYYQGHVSSEIMNSFKNLIPQDATVIRDGKKITLSAADVVIGDIVEIEIGNRIPADIRIFRSQNFKVDNSSLTGESEPQPRGTECTSENPLETKNLAFFSTYAIEGSCRGVVIFTGDGTIMGKIVNLASGVKDKETPIKVELEHFVHLIMAFAIGTGGIFFIAVLCMGYTVLNAVIFGIGVIVGNVPEGLLPTVTVCLTLAAFRMRQKNCLVKNLQALDTLGCASVICSDKTGTLTQNRMTVAHMWFDNYIHKTNTSEIQNGTEQVEYDVNSNGFKSLLQSATLCNRATFKSDNDDTPIMLRETRGDASETALLKFCTLAIGDVMPIRDRNKKVCEIPFNSTNKFQLSIHETEDKNDPRYLILMKGAPERILRCCSTILINDEELPLDETRQTNFINAYNFIGSLGERVLGFCRYYLPNDEYPPGYQFDSETQNFPIEGFCFLGLISMIDPPRASVPDAVGICRNAGIKVTMVTGDHPITAKAIAKAVGIISEGSETAEDIALRKTISIDEVDPKDPTAAVIHGEQLNSMSLDELCHTLFHVPEIVFARTSPQQKLIIVEAYQKLNEVVAVTGDGVNDCPALKQADVGIAMGISGSDVSRQAADIILLDDNFSTIVNGIEEGRCIFDNLKKTIAYSLTANMPEIIPVIIYGVAAIPLPLGTVQMLIICILTDIFPAIALGYEKAESDIMQHPPRDPKKEKLVNGILVSRSYGQIGITEALAGLFTYFVVMGQSGFLPSILFGLREQWESPAINDLKDSYGQEWTFAERTSLLYTANTAYFVAVVLNQCANAIINKCRRKSLFQHGLWNMHLNLALIFEILLAVFLSYTPGMSYIHMYPLKGEWWIPGLPFALYIFVYDELRRLYIKFRPGGLIEQETYF